MTLFSRNRRPLSMLRTLAPAALIASGLGLVAPPNALASDGLYIGLGLGYGNFSGNSLITEELDTGADMPREPGSAGCCPDGGFAFDLRLGWTLFEIVAPEAFLIGNGWDIGSDIGGGGFVGGGLRVFPIGILGIPLDLNVSEFPIDTSLGLFFGWAILGKDFAYTGSSVGFDFTLAYKLTEMLDLGIKIDFVVPSYGDFAYTDYNNDLGRCLSSSGRQEGVIVNRSGSTCNGKGPDASFLSPQLLATFHLPLF